MLMSGLKYSFINAYLVWTEDVGVVVKVTKSAQGMFMLSELDEAITQ